LSLEKVSGKWEDIITANVMGLVAVDLIELA
jgi:hypothetical protein